MNLLINSGSNRSNIWYAEPLFDLAQQFQMDRELHSMIYGDGGFGSGSRGGGGRGGGGGNDRDGGHVFQSGRGPARGNGDSLSTTFGFDQVYNNGLNRSNVPEAVPFIDIAQQLQMDRELLRNMIRGGGGNENGRRGRGGRGRGGRNYRNGGGYGRRGGGGGSRGGGNGNGNGISRGGRN